MRILAFDLGATFGWAVAKDSIVTHFGSSTLKGKTRGHKFFVFGYEVEHLIRLHSPDHVCYECPIPGFPNTVRLLWGYAAKVEEAAAIKKVGVGDYYPTTIKKWFTGSGKATKEDMIAKASQRLDVISKGPVTNDHEADAIALALYAHDKVTFE